MVHPGRLGRMAATFVALGAVIAACGGSGPSAGASTVPATTAPGTITVEATNYQFTPSAITAPAGPVTFSVKNAGTEEHEFEIFKGESVVDEIEGLVPGLTKNLTVNLEAGSYTFVCKLNGHDLLGMTGTLTVQ